MAEEKNKVIRRLKEIEEQYRKNEKLTYKSMMEEYKSGRWNLKPKPVEEQVINCMDCNDEVATLKSWLKGYDACLKEFKLFPESRQTAPEVGA